MTAGNDVFYGDETTNSLSGSAGNDMLYGRGGNDIVAGGSGDDILEGSAGSDTFIFYAGFGNDIITDFSAGSSIGDVIEFHDGIFSDFNELIQAASISGTSTIITVDANTTSTLQHVSPSNLHANDFLFS
jgi:Ca2+-binding RTX toxin-like protein